MKSNQQIDPLSWEVFNNWQSLPKKEMSLPDWQVFDELLPLHNKLLEEQYKLFLPLLERWNAIFSALGKDPTYKNWAHFRPLRLTREEDWADWLAHLIQTSETKNFSRYLLQIDNTTSYSKPVRVLREDMGRQYRTDLIIEWQKQKFTHIEVKIGDMHLSKTFPTCEVFQEKYQVKKENWTNYILLLSEQVPEWENKATNITSDIQIKAIPLSYKCNSDRKKTKDPIEKDRKAFYPFANGEHNISIAIEIDKTKDIDKLERDDFILTLSGEAEKIETWDWLFDISDRYKDTVREKIAYNLVRQLANRYKRNKERNLGLTFTEIIDDHIKDYEDGKFSDKKFLKVAFLEELKNCSDLIEVYQKSNL